VNDPSIFVSVVAPAYNEEKNIEYVVGRWNEWLEKLGSGYEIIIVDDGSTDQTLAILKKLQREIDNLRVLSYQPNRGYGYAMTKATSHVRGEWVVTLDSDGQFDLGDLAILLECQRGGNYDVVTGYRMKKRDSIYRVFANRCLNTLIRILFQLHYRDTNCSLKLYRADVFKKLKIEARGYPTPTEIMVKIRQSGVKIGEAGIHHNKRKAGESKLKPVKTSLQLIFFFFYLRLKLSLFKANIINDF
jgi:glycosyltransferase involved in cell wall biosynthesis